MKKLLLIAALSVLSIGCNKNENKEDRNQETKIQQVTDRVEELIAEIQRAADKINKLEHKIHELEGETHKHYSIGDAHAGGIIFYLDETTQHGKVSSSYLGLFNWEDAVKKCNEYNEGGFTDWYLPSKEELNLMWTNLADSDGNNKNNGPNDQGNRGGFVTGQYWSSTESDKGGALIQNFVNGSQGLTTAKEANLNVQAVRTF